MSNVTFLHALVLVLAFFQSPRPTEMQVGPKYAAGILVPTNQLLQPLGSRIEFPGTPADMAVSPDGAILAVSISKSVNLYSSSGVFQRALTLPAGVTLAGLAFSQDSQILAVSHVSGVTVFNLASGGSRTINLTDPVPCGLAFDASRDYLYVALNTRNLVARVDWRTGQLLSTVAVGVAPFGLAITPSGNHLYVSNWAGRRALANERTAMSSGTPVVVNEQGLPASGSVSVIDLDSFTLTANLEVGLHPSGIQASPDGSVIAVANANSDSVSFIDTQSLSVGSTLKLSAFPQGYIGSSPTALAFSADSERLYVTCAGNNSVVYLKRQGLSYEVERFAATDWYPIAVAVTGVTDHEIVFVANAKGIGSRIGQGTYHVYYRLGTLGRMEMEDFSGSREVSRLNTPFAESPTPIRRSGTGRPPQRPPNLSALGVQHVFLIIKENRTYDQVLGDLTPGNGKPQLTSYGAQITPNHHKLASQFVTLDNFYATGVVSAEGHQWITQAMTTDYIERSYGAAWPRSYPFTGDDPMAFAPSGFIWDNAIRHGRTVRIFGEFTNAVSDYTHTWNEYLGDAQSPSLRYVTPSRSAVASIQPIIEPNYPGFAMNIPDQYRARIFLDKFQEYVNTDSLPNLIILWLPSDHTVGVVPNMPTPDAMMADNDLALGRIVEAISRSPYWKDSVVLVTEDDAQNGFDHVDGHRTICLVASPFARRAVVDSTSYNQTSVVRTIEELLNLPPMNKFDAAALPMRSLFADIPDMSTYQAEPNLVPLSQMNPSALALRGVQKKAALDSMKMNFSIPDAAPEDTLNRILWHAAIGWNKSYPKVPHRRDCKPKDDDDDK